MKAGEALTLAAWLHQGLQAVASRVAPPVNGLLAFLALPCKRALVKLDQLQECLGCGVNVAALRVVEGLARLRIRSGMVTPQFSWVQCSQVDAHKHGQRGTPEAA